MKNDSNVKNDLIVELVKAWVETMVVGLNLCPFAKRELLANRVRFFVSEAKTEEQLLMDLHSELNLLNDCAGAAGSAGMATSSPSQFVGSSAALAARGLEL